MPLFFSGAENNFDIYHHGVIDSLKFPYDFMSATHYDNKDFSKNGQDTIQAIGNPTKRLGNSKGLSKIDMRKILTAYKCYEKKPMHKGEWSLQIIDFSIQFIHLNSISN